MRKGLVILLVLTAFFLSGDLFGQGCSQCKLLAEQGSELDEASFGSNINYGILYLMIIPYLLIMFLFRERIFAFFKKLFKKNPA
jgi:hypothetical protein